MVEVVAVKCGLDHDERVANVLVVENVPVEGCLIGRVVEDLQELRTTQVEHELRVECEVLLQAEAAGVVLAVFGEA